MEPDDAIEMFGAVVEGDMVGAQAMLDMCLPSELDDLAAWLDEARQLVERNIADYRRVGQMMLGSSDL